jgi:hypothetical protein
MAVGRQLEARPMSEYQYYEFRALDRSLTSVELKQLRALSSRAEITSTSFVNTYNFGSFRGDPEKLMAKYFDAFVYVANWGTHELMFRLPRRFVDAGDLARFHTGGSCRVKATEQHVVLGLRAEELEGGWEEGEGWLGSLVPLRADLLNGDLRALYLAWLVDAQNDALEEDQPEPAPPPGLRTLNEPLKSLVEFLGIDADLLDLAAERSADPKQTAPSREQLSTWIADLPETEKNAVLLELAGGESPHLRIEFIRRLQESQAQTAARAEAVAAPVRTVGELLAAAERRSEERKRLEAERRKTERERKEREQSAARAQYLDDLAKSEPETWDRVAALIATKRPGDYDQAAQLLKDLQELAERNQRTIEFRRRLAQIRERYSNRPAFLRRLDAAVPA